MPSITVDAARLPVAVVLFDGVVTDEAFEAYLLRLDELLESEEPYVAIVDARTSGYTPASQRKLKADWLARRRAALARCCLGVVFVIEAPVVRGLLTAIFWVSSLPCPHTVVGTRAEAERWAQGRLTLQSGSDDRNRTTTSV